MYAVFVVVLEGEIVAVAHDHARAHAIRDRVKCGAGVYFGVRYADGSVIYEDNTQRVWP